MIVGLLADAAATWAAVGALATLAATVIALVTALIFTRRQTDMAERAAANARVSATAALDANRTARDALAVAGAQLEVAAAEVAAVERQTILALEALYTAQRPILHADDVLRFEAFTKTFTLVVSNVGAGPGTLREAALVLPTSESRVGVPANPAVARDGTTTITFTHAGHDDPPAGRYEVRVGVANAAGEDLRSAVFHFARKPTDPIAEAARLVQRLEGSGA